MEENNSKGFKIRFDEDEPGSNSELEEDAALGSPALKRPQNRTMASFVVLLLLFGMIVFLLYYHLNQKILQLQNAGTANVQSLNHTIEQQIKELTGKTDQFQQSIQKHLKQLDRKIKSLSGNLGKNKNTLDKSVSEKAGKKDLKTVRKELAKKIKSLRKNVNAISAEMKQMGAGLDRQLQQQSDGIAKQLKALSADTRKLQQNLTELDSRFVGRKKLEFDLDLQAKRYKTEIREIELNLSKKIETLAKTLRKEIESSRKIKKLSSSPVTATSPVVPKPRSATEEKAVQGIIEKDLSE